MFRHFSPKLQASILKTSHVKEVMARFDEVLDDNLMTMFWGEAGLGKTSTVRYLVEACGREVVWLETPADPSPASITREFLEVLTGIPRRGNRYQMAHELLELLALRQPVVCIDEAQRLRFRAVECLRSYWDGVDGGFPLLFIGGDAARRTIERHQMVLSRLRLDYRFEALELDEVLELMPDYHALYKHAEDELLTRVDHDFAHGNLRHWAQFTYTVQKLADRHGRRTLDIDLVHDAYLKHNAPDAAQALTKELSRA